MLFSTRAPAFLTSAQAQCSVLSVIAARGVWLRKQRRENEGCAASLGLCVEPKVDGNPAAGGAAALASMGDFGWSGEWVARTSCDGCSRQGKVGT